MHGMPRRGIFGGHRGDVVHPLPSGYLPARRREPRVPRLPPRLCAGGLGSRDLRGGLRRWVFLPALMITVIALVVFTGGLALNVCFSTVAILFIVEIDNLMFQVGFAERVRGRVEAAGRDPSRISHSRCRSSDSALWFEAVVL